jgi:UDPglucose 6-dehydrogenase
MAINEQQQHVLVDKLTGHFNGDVKGKHFALWGLAFKPDTDDIREASALVIIDGLLKAGGAVTAYDPEAGDNVRALYNDNQAVRIVDDKYAALDGAAALLIATEWKEFVNSDLGQVAAKLAEPLVFDGRNIFHPDQMRQAGFTYYSIGRRPILAA